MENLKWEYGSYNKQGYEFEGFKLTGIKETWRSGNSERIRQKLGQERLFRRQKSWNSTCRTSRD